MKLIIAVVPMNVLHWQGLDKVIKDYVESVTIQDLIDHANMQVNNYSI